MATSTTRLWLFALLIPFPELRAQVALPLADTLRTHEAGKRAPERFMSGQIKHVSEFIDRFNTAAKAENDGEAALRALFNEDDRRLPGLGRLHHPYAGQVDAFVHWAGTGKIRIPKRGVLRAEIGLTVRCNGSSDTLKLYLRKDYTTDSAAYWHVTKVIAPTRLAEEKGNVLKEQKTAVRIELPPNANEVSFLPLLRGLADFQSLGPFTHCSECRDAAWQKVENALQTGRMTAEAVVSNRIYLTAGNWDIILSEFIREKENSGWLISDLIEK